MRRYLSLLWTWNRVIDRIPYLLIGVGLFLVKYAIDWTIATQGFGQSWSPLNYLVLSYALPGWEKSRAIVEFAHALNAPSVTMAERVDDRGYQGAYRSNTLKPGPPSAPWPRA